MEKVLKFIKVKACIKVIIKKDKKTVLVFIISHKLKLMKVILNKEIRMDMENGLI